ncbi:condensation domain-containing protein [Bacillus chungangensis]|uniref:Condensation domain-containing protein n=1 Tax=Bacillus chungangensis TaxID=587633 RepID=A0ABT9WQN4_9BACI|nr:condensation domain-containing protein [Bacillus chungangensis]MDQ0175262.1 hypothetical protein [Bacillus chungangensis]
MRDYVKSLSSNIIYFDGNEATVEKKLVSVMKLQTEISKQLIAGKIENEYPLAPIQYYYLDHMDYSGIFIPFQGELNKDQLNKSILQLINRQQLLRSVLYLEKGQIKWRVYETLQEINIPTIDMSLLSPDLQEKALDKIIKKVYLREYKKFNSIFYRIILIKKSPHDFLLIMPFSHIIFDFFSSEVLKNELMNLYFSFNQEESPMPQKHYWNYVQQILQGPQLLSDQELCDVYELADLNKLTKAISLTINQQPDSGKKVNVIEFNMDYLVKDTNSDTFLSDIFYYSAAVCRMLLDLKTSKIPIWCISLGRVYQNEVYFDLVGEFIDFIPTIIDLDNRKAPIAQSIKKKIQIAQQHNINFIGMIYNHKVKEKNVMSSKFIRTCLTENLIILNVLGMNDEVNGSLEQLIMKNSHFKPDNKIIIEARYSKNKINFKLFLPFEVDNTSLKVWLGEEGYVHF